MSMPLDRWWAALAGICEAGSLDPTGASLIKLTNSAVFDLPRQAVVVKVAGSSLVADRIPAVLHVARWLEAEDFPAVRLVHDLNQPVRVGGHAATVWHRVGVDGSTPTGGDLARLIRRFHQLRPAPDLPPWDPIRSIRRRLADADGPDPADLAFLAERCDEIETELSTLSPALPPGPIHGDAFLGNLIPRSRPVLCDFDSTSIGPREWDLTPVAVGSVRFAYTPDPQPSFAQTYGFDVTQWSGFPTLRRLRELQLVSSAVPTLATNPSVRRQFEHRLATLKAGTSDRWQPYSRSFEGRL